MAVALEFINFIVPKTKIERKYPGGWEGCLKDHQNLVGRRIWYDDYLFRDGAMNPIDINQIVDDWETRGFQGKVTSKDGKMSWSDFCVIEGLNASDSSCSWLTLDFGSSGRMAYLKGTDPGVIVDRYTHASS